MTIQRALFLVAIVGIAFTLAACSSSHSAATPPTPATASSTSIVAPAGVSPICIRAVRAMATFTNGFLGTRDQTGLPFRRLLDTSLNDCATKNESLTTMTAYLGDDELTLAQLFDETCIMARGLHTTLPNGRPVLPNARPIPTSCKAT